MRLKLDENLGARGAELLRAAGHDVATVPEQALCSASDRSLIDVCRREDRGLVTLDLDFGNPLLFPPRDYAGIAVLRLGAKPSADDLIQAVRTLVAGLEKGPLLDASSWPLAAPLAASRGRTGGACGTCRAGRTR